MGTIGYYHSPIGGILLSADEIGLTELRFTEQKETAARETPAILAAKTWLDIYFSGQVPDFTPPLHLTGTPYQMEVWDILRSIPHGCSTTYGEIAKQIAARRGMAKMSAQAVGGAVGRNRIAIIIPCHRVLGSNGALTGYSGGLAYKIKLLELEKIQFVP